MSGQETQSPAPIQVPLPKGFNSLDEAQLHANWVETVASRTETLGKGVIAASAVIAQGGERSRFKTILTGAAFILAGQIGKEVGGNLQKDVMLFEYCAASGIVELTPNP